VKEGIFLHILDSISQNQIVPFIRWAMYGKRKHPIQPKERRLLDYQLIYLQEGRGALHIEEEVYEVHEGQFVLIQPGQLHNLFASEDLVFPLIHFDIFYNPLREQGFWVPHGIVDLSPYLDLLQPRLNDYEGIHVPVIVQPQQPSLTKETMLKAVGLWQHRDPFSQLEASHLVTELVIGLLKQYSTVQNLTRDSTTSLQWITPYLLLHLSEPIQVMDMAKQASLSVSRFSALFTEQFHIGPHQYLLHLRIQQAQQLLKNDALTLSDIAEMCGFSDMHHLSKTFKRVTGLTPRDFRKSLYS
jgi:AraC-like DNA-binding protein